MEKGLKGMTVVLRSDTGDKIGEIADAIIHPVEGKLMGLIVRTDEGQERALATPNFFIGKDAVIATAGARFTERWPRRHFRAWRARHWRDRRHECCHRGWQLLGRVSKRSACRLRCPALSIE